MAPALISVAVCTRNGAAFLRAQLQSIIAQTLPPAEIVLSDDASSDDTVAIARELLADSGIAFTIIENAQPLGVTANFESAILACAHPLVALSDQDDEWMPHRLERAAALFESRPTLELVHSDAALVDGEGRDLSATLFEALGVSAAQVSAIHHGAAFALFARRNLVTGAATMLRRSLAERAAPFASAWLHDEWLAIVAAAAGTVDVIDEPLIRYRQHGGNQVGVTKLGVAGKIGRMLEPGAARNERLLRRAVQLADRFDELSGISADQREAVADKRAHEVVRSALSRHRLLRIAPVLRELRTGRYSRFGRGPADAVRDLVQPLNDAR